LSASAQLVGGDRPREVAAQDEVHATDARLGRRVHGVEAERHLERRERFLVAAERGEGAAPVAPHLGEVGPQRERAVERDDARPDSSGVVR
jgi:hypothetical protein